ncbi:MAG: hypothetical protein KAT69_07380 [Candidatus Aminicenantes bacterium]|nr:hypothetical protein [Candidatus Aminicenantes bacterium]
MRFRTKVAIFLVAVLLTLVGFNLMATPPALDLLKGGKAAGNEVVVDNLANAETAPHYSTSL